jgi:hypothetical protein
VAPSCLANLRNHNLLKSLNLFFSQAFSVPLLDIIRRGIRSDYGWTPPARASTPSQCFDHPALLLGLIRRIPATNSLFSYTQTTLFDTTKLGVIHVVKMHHKYIIRTFDKYYEDGQVARDWAPRSFVMIMGAHGHYELQGLDYKILLRNEFDRRTADRFVQSVYSVLVGANCYIRLPGIPEGNLDVGVDLPSIHPECLQVRRG